MTGTPSQCHQNVTATPSQHDRDSQHHRNTIKTSPGHHHNMTGTPSQRHQDTMGHHHNMTGTPSQCHQNATGTPSQHDRDTITTRQGHHQSAAATPSQRDRDTITTSPGHHRNITRTPSQRDRDTITTWPGHPHNMTGTPSQHDWDTTTTWPGHQHNAITTWPGHHHNIGTPGQENHNTIATPSKRDRDTITTSPGHHPATRSDGDPTGPVRLLVLQDPIAWILVNLRDHSKLDIPCALSDYHLDIFLSTKKGAFFCLPDTRRMFLNYGEMHSQVVHTLFPAHAHLIQLQTILFESCQWCDALRIICSLRAQLVSLMVYCPSVPTCITYQAAHNLFPQMGTLDWLWSQI